MTKADRIEKYIINLNERENLKELGKEGYERKQMLDLGINSPTLFFVSDYAFHDFILSLGYGDSLKKPLIYDEQQELADAILKEDLLDEILSDIEIEYKKLTLHDKYPLVEIRLSNKDQDRRYLEQVKPVLIYKLEDLITEIKKAWIRALDGLERPVIVQVVQIFPYDISGYAYVDSDVDNIEVNSIFGLWLNNEKVDHYDICFADFKTLKTRRYVVGKQKSMMVKSGKEIKEMSIGEDWINAYKLSKTQLQKVLNISKELAQLFNKAVEFSFGFYKNKVYLHDLKELKTDLEEDEYFFADDFFDSSSELELDGFKNQVEAISSMELPFFLSNDLKVIEKKVEEASGKTLISKRLHRDLSEKPLIDQIKDNAKLFYNLEDINKFYKLLDKADGVSIELSKFTKVSGNINEKSSEKVYQILQENLKRVTSYLDSLRGKDVILRLSSLRTDNKKTKPRFLLNFSKTVDLSPLRRVGLEIMLMKELLNKYNFENISFQLPSLSTLEEFQYLHNLFNLSGIPYLKSDKAHFYLNLSTPSLLFEINQKNFSKNNLLNGVVISLDEFMNHFFGKSSFSPRDADQIINFFKGKLKTFKDSKQVDSIFAVGDNIELGKKLLELNPYAIVVNYLDSAEQF